ncbi:MAG: chromate transporter, partial [Oscillospiraceae bacterium]|nr:chromate transporter [Oscillospiraceae bacterium]
MRDFWDIYWKFFKMGAVTFGGGYAMLPILRREIVEKSGWMREEEILDYYALSQG